MKHRYLSLIDINISINEDMAWFIIPLTEVNYKNKVFRTKDAHYKITGQQKHKERTVLSAVKIEEEYVSLNEIVKVLNKPFKVTLEETFSNKCNALNFLKDEQLFCQLVDYEFMTDQKAKDSLKKFLTGQTVMVMDNFKQVCYTKDYERWSREYYEGIKSNYFD